MRINPVILVAFATVINPSTVEVRLGKGITATIASFSLGEVNTSSIVAVSLEEEINLSMTAVLFAGKCSVLLVME